MGSGTAEMRRCKPRSLSRSRSRPEKSCCRCLTTVLRSISVTTAERIPSTHTNDAPLMGYGYANCVEG